MKPIPPTYPRADPPTYPPFGPHINPIPPSGVAAHKSSLCLPPAPSSFLLGLSLRWVAAHSLARNGTKAFLLSHPLLPRGWPPTDPP